MSEPVLPIATEREIYRDYERNRRLYLARILLPVFALVQFAVFFVSVIVVFSAHFEPPIVQIFVFNTALVGMDAALHAVGLLFVRRGEVRYATICLIVPAGITIVAPALIWDFFYQAGPQMVSPILAITLSEVAATPVLIVLAGLLATNRWTLVGTTLLMNGYTLFILTNALRSPEAGAALRSNAALLLAFPIFVQWAVMGILIAAAGTYVQTLRELGDVRVAFARAQQLDQLKNQFIAHVNHELRSPVMALQGHVELLLLLEDNLAPEERHTYLERAKHAGDDLVSLVTSILSVQRLEADRETHVPAAVGVRAALDAAIHLIDPREGRSIERELRVHVPDELDVWAEPVRVRQILINLLSNAVKYSPPGTPVEVAAEIVPAKTAGQPDAKPRPRLRSSRSQTSQASEPRRWVQITVRDFGLGIPAGQIPLLFKQFVRLPRDLASNVPGNGLGLYLCRTLAEAMGGTIWVESAGVEGEGTTIYLQLPAPPESGVSPSQPQ
jgi:signal transduction histidine kinase